MLIRNVMLAAVAALAVAACEDKKDDFRTSPPPPAAPNAAGGTVTNTGATMPTQETIDPIANATNLSAISRFGDEVKLTPTPDRVVAAQMTLRDAPFGNTIGIAKGGDAVTQVARERGYVLVLTADPKQSDRSMAAWVYQDAFKNARATREKIDPKAAAKSKTATSATGEKILACENGERSMRSDHEFCAKTCRVDGECKSGTCDGNAVSVNADGRDTEEHYCIEDHSSPSREPLPTR